MLAHRGRDLLHRARRLVREHIRHVEFGSSTSDGHIRIGVGPVTAASWTLTVALHDREEPASYGMKVESKGPLGFTRGSASVELLDDPAGTRMKYRADMQIGGKVAGWYYKGSEEAVP